MKIHAESRGVPPGGAVRGGGAEARARTSPAIDLPRVRGGEATDPARSSRWLGLVCFSLLAAAACDPYIQGNGVYYEEDRSSSIGPFSGLRLEEGIAATLTAGTADRNVLLSGDANVVKYIRTVITPEIVRGTPIDVLRVYVDAPSGGYSSTYPLRATIRVPEIGFAHAEGERARIDLRDVATPELVLEAKDQAEIIVRGTSGQSLHATLSDAAIDAGGYVVDTADVMLTGASRLELQAEIEVTGEAWDTSEVDNLLGAGICNVALHDTASLLCN